MSSEDSSIGLDMLGSRAGFLSSFFGLGGGLAEDTGAGFGFFAAIMAA